MSRLCNPDCLIDDPVIREFGLNLEVVQKSISYVQEIFDDIDSKLVAAGSERLAELVELANLSAIIGNLFRGGIVKYSYGRFVPNRPHTFPDLLAKERDCKDFEIKVALENNKPKGHLVKPGPHLIVRYVLGNIEGEYNKGKENRGNVVWIWEIRIGYLLESHFNFSNTEGDSGKTAVINSAGMDALRIVYLDRSKSPLAR